MNDLLDAINPWHLMFDLLGWCILAAVVLVSLGSFLGFIGGMVAGLIRKGRGK